MLFLISKSNLIPLQEYHFKVYGESVFFDISKAKKVTAIPCRKRDHAGSRGKPKTKDIARYCEHSIRIEE